jgi:hypothetical protein
MANQSIAALDAALKDLYIGQKLIDLCYAKHPFLALIPKFTKFAGRKLPLPIKYGRPQGRSATFASALANSSASKFESFDLTRKSDYGVTGIDGEALEAASNDPGSFINSLQNEIDGIMESLSESCSRALFGNGSGAIGQVLAEPAEAALVITLKQIKDIVHFEVGQTINIWSAESGGTQRNSDGSDVSWPVIAVDRSAGTVTLDETYTSSGTIAANDYIFIEGDRGNMLSGLGAWFPWTAPGATPFFGVDRSVDVVRLSGVRVDGSAKNVREAIFQAFADMQIQSGGTFDVVVMNPEQWRRLAEILQSSVVYGSSEVSISGVKVGFRTILLMAPWGEVKVVSDGDCPLEYAYGLNMSTIKLYSLGDVPKFLNGDGLRMLRQASGDGYEIRVGYRGNVGCSNPGSNCVIKLQA